MIGIDLKTLQSGETEQLEFKEKLPEKSDKYLKTIVAFANGKGGKIVFGVRDSDHAVIGVPQEHIFRTMDAIANSVADCCEPCIYPNISRQNVAGKIILIVSVSPGQQKPYHIKALGAMKGTYIRVGATTRPADDAVVHEMYYENPGRSYDRSVDAHSELAPNELKLLCKQLTEIAEENCSSETERRRLKPVTSHVLKTWGVISEQNGVLRPNHAFSILIGKDPLITKIQCALFEGTTRVRFLDKRDCIGFLPNQINEATQFVLKHIRRGSTIEGIYRKDKYELPPDSIRELIVNAVLHRSYLQPGCVQVAVYDDRVEITSPGRWVAGMSSENIREGYSRLRNYALAEVFGYLNVCEKWGSGIPRAFEEMNKRGLREPQFEESDFFLRVVLYRRIMDPLQLESTIIRELQSNPTITQTDIARRMNVSPQSIKRIFQNLRKKGILSRKGNNRSGEWIIHEDEA